jgi:antibiotic biosynthesis monooxygenase (ABM) superfamily enzyme
MTGSVIVQGMDFESKLMFREDGLAAREAWAESRESTSTIVNEKFVFHCVRQLRAPRPAFAPLS